MSKILLIEDLKTTHLLLRSVFDTDPVLSSVFNLKQARQLLAQETFDLILLDIILPDGNGFEFCAELRRENHTKNTPVIFLTGKSDLAAKSLGFSLGAEDYIVKPFDPHEVKLRCTAKLARLRVQQGEDSQFRQGDLLFQIPSQRVFLTGDEGETELELTPTGFKLLLYMARHPTQVFTRDQLITAVWGPGISVVDRTIDTHIGVIRKQLGESTVSIQAVQGVGYKLVKSLGRSSAA